MVPIVLRELYLPPLRGDEENVGGHKKKGERYWKTVREKKNIIVPRFYRDRGSIMELLEML
jgi:hypothetical protein